MTEVRMSARKETRPPRRKVLRHTRFCQVTWQPYTLYLDCGHVVGSSRVGKTAGCRQCSRIKP